MPYVTHILRASMVDDDIRLSPSDAILAELFPENYVSKARHTRNYFSTRTFYTDNPKHYPIDQAFISLLYQEHVKEYITFRIPKASGGTRTIEAPAEPLKQLQRDVAYHIQNHMRVHPHHAAYAYTRGRCALDAMVVHQQSGARWFLKLDIRNFFPSITSELLLDKVFNIYPLNFIEWVERNALVELAVNNDGVLPQGSPISPLLSNLVMLEFDLRLSAKLRRFNHQTYTYTRYADDILISCPYEFKFMDIVHLIEEVFESVHLPFQINHTKTRYGSAAGRNWNLGLMYNKDLQITIGNKKKKELHSLVNNFVVDYKSNTPWDKSSTQELIGKLGYLKNIEPDYYRTLINKYQTKYTVLLSEIFKEVLNQ